MVFEGFYGIFILKNLSGFFIVLLVSHLSNLIDILGNDFPTWNTTYCLDISETI